MTGIIIFGCVVLALLFLVLAFSIRWIHSILESFVSILDVWLILIFGGLLIGAIELLMKLFEEGIGHAFLIVVLIVVVISVAGAVLAFFGYLALLAGEIALMVALYAGAAVHYVLDFLGKYSELAMKYFLSVINKQVDRA